MVSLTGQTLGLVMTGHGHPNHRPRPVKTDKKSSKLEVVPYIMVRILGQDIQKTGQNRSETGKLNVVPYIMVRILEPVTSLELADRSEP